MLIMNTSVIYNQYHSQSHSCTLKKYCLDNNINLTLDIYIFRTEQKIYVFLKANYWMFRVTMHVTYKLGHTNNFSICEQKHLINLCMRCNGTHYKWGVKVKTFTNIEGFNLVILLAHAQRSTEMSAHFDKF